MQTGSKGSIFLHPTSGGVEDIREILLGRGPISISMFMLCISSSPLHFYQIIEDSNYLSWENEHL